MHKTVEMPDNAATKGMIQQVQHLVKVEELIKNIDKEVPQMDLSNLRPAEGSKAE